MTHPINVQQLIGPGAAKQLLNIDEHELVALVNSAELPAYDLGGALRFKEREVAALRKVEALRTGGR